MFEDLPTFRIDSWKSDVEGWKYRGYRYARAISFARQDKTGTRYISLRRGEAAAPVYSRQKSARARMVEGDTDNKKSWDIK